MRESEITAPLSGESMRPMRRMSVDFPAPFGPINPMLALSGKRKFKSRNTYRRPWGVRYDLVSWRSSITAAPSQGKQPLTADPVQAQAKAQHRQRERSDEGTT